MNLSEQNSSSTEIYKSSFNYTNLSVSSNTPIHNESNFNIDHNQDEAIPQQGCDITNVNEFSSPGSDQVNDERQSLLCHDEKDIHDNNNNGIVIKCHVLEDNEKSCDREDSKLELRGENNDENPKESITKITTSIKSLKKPKITKAL